MNKKASVIIEILVFLVAIVFVSAGLLALVKTGVIVPKERATQEVLNTEFLPIGREANLNLREVSFCSYVDENNFCYDSGDRFVAKENIYLLYSLDAGTNLAFESFIVIKKNNEIVVDVFSEQPTSTSIIQQSGETIFFRLPTSELSPGNYEVELLVEDSNSGLKDSVVKKLVLEEIPIEYE